MKKNYPPSTIKWIPVLWLIFLFSSQGCQKTTDWFHQNGNETPTQKIKISTLAQLYDAVSNTANAGALVQIEAGIYVLDSTYANKGRLELQENMELQGQVGRPDLVIIDASALPGSSFAPPANLPAPRTGAIRMGRGSNSLEWLTVKGNATTQALSAIDADLIWTGPSNIKIMHSVITGGRIGIDIRNAGTSSRNRKLPVEIGNNEIKENLVQFGQGIEVQNANGASGGIVQVVLHDNNIHGNKIGLRAFSNNANGTSTDSGSLTIQSYNDHFDENGVGLQLISGLNQATAKTANNNFLHFEANGTTVQNNLGVQSPDITDPLPGGINAAGGFSSNGANTSNNKLEIILSGCTVTGNQGPGIKAFGAFSSLPVPVLAGTNNSVIIKLEGISKKTIVESTVSVPAEPAATNTVSVTY